jgi:RNA polymerase sigma factor (sigma-70 family)
MLTSTFLHRLVRQLRRPDDSSDAQLLERFQSGDRAALEMIMRRHGPGVLSACRKVLSSAADVEDAFQATFVILIRKADTIRNRAALGGWLAGVAHRLALQALDAATRRERAERQKRPATEGPGLSWREACAVLHEELDRLPDKYRLPLLLCYLEGKSRDEAAQQLGVSLNALRGRLERGRERLRARLTKRGIALSAGLLAVVADAATAGALPDRLLRATLHAAATDRLPPAVAAIVRGAGSPVALGKVKLLAAVVVAVALISGGISLGMHRVVPRSPDRATASTEGLPKPVETSGRAEWHGQETVPQLVAAALPDKPAEPVKPPADGVEGAATYGGRVLDPDGKPVAGAKLYALYYTPKVLPIPARGASDKDGGFGFTVERKEFDRGSSARPWDEVVVVATADGYGLGVPNFERGKPFSHAEMTLRLAKDDTPIRGRILDLQGQPVAGATVSVHEFFWPAKGDLTAWLAALKEKREGWTTLREHLMGLDGGWMGRDVGRVLPSAVTDAEGRFRLSGVGRERVVALRVEGPTIVSTELWAMTRKAEKVEADAWRRGDGGKMVFFGAATGDHLVPPCRPIAGVVRDKDTGKPVPGAVVESYVFAGTNLVGRTHLRAVADNEARYRLLGMPKGDGNQVRVRPPDGQPYVTAVARVPDGPGLEPAALDLKLKRGVWITGKVTDKATGKPVAAMVRYVVLGDNPNLKAAPGATFDEVQTRGDGSFRFVGLPGRAAVTAQAFGSGYLADVGGDKIKGLRDTFQVFRFNTAAEVNPEKGAESVTCDLALDPGRTLTGKVVGPDGKPLAGARVSGCRDSGGWEDLPENSAEFKVVGLDPAEPRLLQFSHAGEKLAGSLVVRGDEKGPLTVKLEPAGVLTGRFVSLDGKPLADLGLFADMAGPVADLRQRLKPDVTVGSFPDSPHTDKDGKFRIEGLAPGLKYRPIALRGMYALLPEGEARNGATVKAGEAKDIGELKVRLPDE